MVLKRNDMKRPIFTLIFPAILFTLFALLKCSSEQKKEQHEHAEPNEATWNNYTPIPAGFDYPANTQTLQAAVDSADIKAIRTHAWAMFAGIMQPMSDKDNSWPLWYSWPNSVDAMRIKQIYCQHDISKLEAEENKREVKSLIHQNKLHLNGTILDTLHAPYYPIPQQVIEQFKDKDVFTNTNYSAIIPGKHFMFNGDILIPTESISLDGFKWINTNKFYDSKVMDSIFKSGTKNLDAPSSYIITKHMYWPVLKGQLNLVPVWNESKVSPTYAGYVGYETWNDYVAIDPGKVSPQKELSYLYGIYNWDTTALIGPKKCVKPDIHSINEFYHHQITKEDWDSFDASDKAILMASSYWAYGKPIGVGDYLVTIATHVNTKEIYSWTMQSAWWTNKPTYGKYSKDRPALANAKGPWQHYDLVDAYGVPVSSANQLPIAMNPYIELVTHPLQTNCNNCHMRAGYPEKSSSFANGASYQNKTCQDLLMKLLPNTPCLEYYTRSDFQWIIPDYTHKQLLCKEKKK